MRRVKFEFDERSLESVAKLRLAGHEVFDMGLTTDPQVARSSPIKPDGQQETYLVLSEEERAKGFVRPVRQKYKHLACGVVTHMGLALAETYARDPEFYGGTFCVGCHKHFALVHWDEAKGESVRAFVWDSDGQGVGT